MKPHDPKKYQEQNMSKDTIRTKNTGTSTNKLEEQ